MEPRALDVSEDGTKVTIVWSDSHRSIYSSVGLRSACPCAVCKGEPGVFGKYYGTSKLSIFEDVRADEIRSVGRYALKFIWSGGHDLGIYPFDYLRSLCECEDCRKKKH